jgi:hypothetical protein
MEQCHVTCICGPAPEMRENHQNPHPTYFLSMRSRGRHKYTRSANLGVHAKIAHRVKCDGAGSRPGSRDLDQPVFGDQVVKGCATLPTSATHLEMLFGDSCRSDFAFKTKNKCQIILFLNFKFLQFAPLNDI